MWAGGKRGIPAQQSPAIGDCRLLHPLTQKTWAQQALLTGMPWEPLSGTGQRAVVGVGLWRRTVARLTACLCGVSAEFLCWSSRKVALLSSLRKGTVSHTWWYMTRSREGGYTSALSHHSILNARKAPAALFGECNLAAKGAQAAGAGVASSPTCTQPTSMSSTGFRVCTFREGRAGAIKKICWGYHSTKRVVTYIMNWCECLWEHNFINQKFFGDHKQECRLCVKKIYIKKNTFILCNTKNTSMLAISNDLAIPVFLTDKEKYGSAVCSLILLGSHALSFHECSSASRWCYAP